jgi:hypothetical protein
MKLLDYLLMSLLILAITFCFRFDYHIVAGGLMGLMYGVANWRGNKYGVN